MEAKLIEFIKAAGFWNGLCLTALILGMVLDIKPLYNGGFAGMAVTAGWMALLSFTLTVRSRLQD